MKIIYNASTSSQKYYPVTGCGLQQVLVVIELDNDHYVFVADNSTSKIHLMRIINKYENNTDLLFHGFNMAAIEDQEQFDYLYDWFDNHFNYQDRHKEDKIDNG